MAADGGASGTAADGAEEQQQRHGHPEACAGDAAAPARVPHIPQQYSWDCGLACVLMVLRALGRVDVDLQRLRQLSATTSVWTIDLAHLLAHFGAAVTFCTITIGINQGYANEWFYMESLERDEARVRGLFSRVGELGIAVQQRSVPLAELVAAVGGGGALAVLLVDRRKIDPWQAAADLAWNYTTGVTSATSYAGHYVLLVGHEPAAAAAPASTGSSSTGGSGGSVGSGAWRQQQQRTEQQQGASVAGSSSGDDQQQERDAPTDMASGGGGGPAGADTPPPHAQLGYFLVQDPAQLRGPVRIPVGVVESARRSFGTDEDLLLVEMVPRTAPGGAGRAARCGWCAAAAAARRPGDADGGQQPSCGHCAAAQQPLGSGVGGSGGSSAVPPVLAVQMGA